MRVKSLKARSAVSVAAVAAIGVTGLVAAPAASAATTTTAALAVDVPYYRNGIGFQSLRIDNGTSVTCLAPDPAKMTIAWLSRLWSNVDYQVSAGTTYGVSSWSGFECGADGGRFQADVTVTPTEADLSGPSTNPVGEPTPGVYWVRIP